MLCVSRFNKQTHLTIKASLSDCQRPSDPGLLTRSWWHVMRTSTTHPTATSEPPWAPHSEATSLELWWSWDKKNTLEVLGTSSPVLSHQLFPCTLCSHLTAHSRDQPKQPHSATQKQGGLRQQSRNCWISFASPRSDRGCFTHCLKSYPASRVSQPPEEGEEEEGGREDSPVFPCLFQLPTSHI